MVAFGGRSRNAVAHARALQSIRWLAWTCGLAATGLAIRYADQKPLDHFSFRQTQTAITAYWLSHDGFSLAYETPVVGEPWSIPFEFPIYEAVVALLSRTLGTHLDATGRLVSFAFLLACVPQVLAITRRLRLSPLVFPIFCALLFASPTYVYWGRSFTIETAALFFCVAAVRRFVDLCVDPTDRWSPWLLLLFLSLGMLQKITTAAPVALVLGPAFLLIRRGGPRRVAPSGARWRALTTALVCFGVPLLLGASWTLFTDRIKELNAFGQQLTSSELRSWNTGPLGQRFEGPLYEQVVWHRIVERNLGGPFGLLLLLAAGALARTRRAKQALLVSLLLGAMPVLVFANLHLAHDYYTCSNLVFVLFALAVALGDILARHARWPVVLLALGFVVTHDAVILVSDDLPVMRAVYVDAHDTEMAIATVLHRHVPPDRIFVAFDFDWSSSLAYLSERKASMFSVLHRHVDAARTDPTRFVDAATLGAVVACPKSARQLGQLVDWSVRGRRWMIGLVDDCYVAVPERFPAPDRVAPSTDACRATAITVLPVREDAAMRVVRVRTPTAERPATGYLTGTSPTDLHEMLDVTRRSPRPGIDHGDVPDREFTRLVVVGDDAAIRVYRRSGDRIDECRVVGAPSRP